MPRGTNPALEIFLNLVFPWGDKYDQLYKSVSWTFSAPELRPDGKMPVANYATQSYDDLLRLIESRANRAAANVYVALGTQRLASIEKFTADGFPKAIRKINNIVSFKSIYLDLDVKPGGYATTDDAYDALDDFIDKAGLPAPTMEVLSGTGGVHVYWCTKDPMPVDAWSALARGLRDAAIAYGLKFDPQITVNAAGILRPPGTWNHKRIPPLPVVLDETTSFHQYDYQQLVQALKGYVGVVPGIRLATSQQPAAGSYTLNFTENVPGAPPVPIDAVAVECGVIADILDRGGAGDAEPLWNLALYLASFTSNPADAAHALSDGDSRYVPAETDAKLQEKIMARASNQAAGWPQCSSFSPLHAACQTCPHFAAGKSPLNFARPPVVQQQIQQMITTQAASADVLMPNDYWRDQSTKHVWTTIDTEKGVINVDVLGQPVIDAGIDPTTGDLVVRTNISGNDRWGSVHISGNMQPVSAMQALAKGTGIFVMPHNHKHARDFLVAWMTRLQEAKLKMEPANLGWTKDGKGFTFGDKTYFEKSTDIAFRGSTPDARFEPAGELKPWQDAMRLVYGNPPLEAVVASAFAAPLVALTGSNSLVLSVFSHLSGVGKSTAMQLAQAVWGNPRTAMSSLDDTYNSVSKKVADLNSLPCYWDELRTQKDLDEIVKLVFQVTQGKSKSRLNRDATAQAVGSFTTMFAVASNYGLTDTIYSNTDATEAGGLRLFEIEAGPLSGAIKDFESRQLVIPLASNYGNAGARYAAFLAQNKVGIRQAVTAQGVELAERYSLSPKERFWAMTVTTLLLGAQLSNRCGLTSFDVPALTAFLGQELQRQRLIMKQQAHTTLSDPEAVKSLIGDMISECRGKNVIFTDKINYGAGKPQPARLIDTDVSKLQDVWIQKGVEDERIRLRLKPFNKWLRDHHQHPNDVRRKLEAFYFVSQNKSMIGAGVPFLDIAAIAGRSDCLDLTPRWITTSPGSNPD